jgi:hypothetical protein
MRSQVSPNQRLLLSGPAASTFELIAMAGRQIPAAEAQAVRHTRLDALALSGGIVVLGWVAVRVPGARQPSVLP